MTRTAKATEAYYTTSYALRTGTTSTTALLIWQALSDHLSENGLPITGTELAETTGTELAVIDRLFNQNYYQRSYGFRRFATLKEWRTWAEDSGVLYVPEKHGVLAEPEADGETGAPLPEEA